MKQLKKTILTLVALIAVTTGAWAQTQITQDFENGLGDWTMTNCHPSSEISSAYTSHGGDNTFRFCYTANPPQYLISPEIDAAGGGTMSFYYAIFSNSYPEKFKVGYSTTTNDPTAFTWGNEVTCTNIYTSEYLEYTYDIPAGAKYVAIACTSNDKYYLFIDDIKIEYVAASAASAVTVDWNKTSKTGTFTMPGDNVFVVPDYYPQAALTAAPTAINDVPATTDGAIVKAGTVANIGSTTTAQGTVMYYVSPTALDDAALLALAADVWKADVPTAKSLAQGQAYVYYYVRGNDSDTDEENFSDGDILASNALTVTIAAEPTYDVTYAKGTQDADKWTVKAGTDGSFQSLPLEGVKAGTKVKLKYDGDRSMLKGVKATSDAKPAATVKTITIAADFHTSGQIATAPEITIEYNEGEKWSDVAARYDWLKMYETYTVYYDADSKSGDLHTADGGVKPSDLVDPNKSYYWGFE